MHKLMRLRDAVARHVRPGQHVNFASTPARANAALGELCRQLRGTDPGLTLSATGFHSLAHLLGLERLGRRYIGCFFGDNCPTPRPSPLYERLAAEGAQLEHWSLLSYVSALRAGAMGEPYATTQSLAGTTLGQELAARGDFVEIPDPANPTAKLGLVRALRADLVFMHAPCGDARGRVAFSPPHAEGFYGALGAREGVIVTVDRLVDEGVMDALAPWIPLPPQRVLAICEVPFGAHPQPLHVASRELPVQSYRDDEEHYELWARMARDPSAFREFQARVLERDDFVAAYAEFVGVERWAALRAARVPHSGRGRSDGARLSAEDRLVLLAARTIVQRVREAGHTSILAGIGQSFQAARLAKLLLGSAGRDVELLVETGIVDTPPEGAHPFLLSQENMARAARLSSVEAVLGSLVCGAGSRCLGVLGAAQVDATGAVNSSCIGGRPLVGSGGANDIASSADEVMVLTTADPRRLVEQVEFVTSPGQRVTRVVTDAGVLERDGARWRLRDVGLDGADPDLLRDACRWPLAETEPAAHASPPSAVELQFLRDNPRDRPADGGRRPEERPPCSKSV